MMELKKTFVEKIESIDSNQTLRFKIFRIQSHLEVVKKNSSLQELFAHLQRKAMQRDLTINELRMVWIGFRLLFVRKDGLVRTFVQLNLQREIDHLRHASSDPWFLTIRGARVRGIGGDVPVLVGQNSIIVARQCKTFCNVDWHWDVPCFLLCCL